MSDLVEELYRHLKGTETPDRWPGRVTPNAVAAYLASILVDPDRNPFRIGARFSLTIPDAFGVVRIDTRVQLPWGKELPTKAFTFSLDSFPPPRYLARLLRDHVQEAVAQALDESFLVGGLFPFSEGYLAARRREEEQLRAKSRELADQVIARAAPPDHRPAEPLPEDDLAYRGGGE